MHVFVLEDHTDGGDVAQDANDENDRVDDGNWNDSGQRKMLRSQVLSDVRGLVGCGGRLVYPGREGCCIQQTTHVPFFHLQVEHNVDNGSHIFFVTKKKIGFSGLERTVRKLSDFFSLAFFVSLDFHLKVKWRQDLKITSC